MRRVLERRSKSTRTPAKTGRPKPPTNRKAKGGESRMEILLWDARGAFAWKKKLET